MTVQDRTPDRLGPYRLLERLGEGGMGIVYLARDPGERMVAVKALRPGVAAEATARRRLTREVETMRRVDSRFVAEVIDADVTSDPPYIVTRYVPGRTLDDVVGESGPLGGEALARLARGLADALAAVHAAGVVHRDLKPGNVMLVDGEPVVIDFGIAQLPETTRITMTGMFMGTPGYLAPEVIEGKQSGPASDVHSWGATVAYAATGRPPFGTGSFETIFYRIVHGQPDLGSIPSPLLSMVARTLARDPARRPAAGELCEWAATLDPSSLVPGAAAAVPGVLPPAPGTLADQPAAGIGVQRREITRPLAGAGGAAGAGVAGGAAGGARAAGAAGGAGGAGVFGDGFRDLLPPVRYGQAPAPAGAQPRSPAGAAGQAARRTPGTARSAWSPQVIAAMAVAVAAAVAFPLAGTAAALAGLIMLRVGDLTGHRLARRRSRQGSRTGDLLVAGAYFPLGLCRSAIRFTLLAPLGLLWAGIAAAITIIVLPAHPLPRAFSYGAGALIAFYAIGPGSGGCRKPLGRLLGVARTPAAAVAMFVAIAALALVAIAVAVSQPPFYWPASHLTTQLAHQPALHSVISDIRQSLVRLAAHFGL
jgi:Protein kinase domain